MSTRTTHRALAGLIGAGLILGVAAPAFADGAITPVPPAASGQGALQVALDKAQQDVNNAQSALDAAKAAESQAYDELDAAWQQAVEDVTTQITSIAATYAALQAAQSALDAAEQAYEEGVANLEQLQADVNAARAEVDRTAVDGKDALEIVAADYLTRVSPKEADKLLRCEINANSTSCKNATTAFDQALAAHKEFAEPHEAAAEAYSQALLALAEASARLELAQGNLGAAAVDALRWARDEAQRAFDAAVQGLVDLVEQRAEILITGTAAIAKAEATTEVARGRLRAAKAILKELTAHVTPPGDGTHDDNFGIDGEVQDGTAEDGMGIDGEVQDGTAEDGMGIDGEVQDGTAEDSMGIDGEPEPTPEPGTPAPDTGTATTPTTQRVVYKMTSKSGKKWTVVHGRAGAIPQGARVTVRTPAKPKAKNLAAAKAKAKRVAASHAAKYTGVEHRSALRKARVVVTWTTAN